MPAFKHFSGGLSQQNAKNKRSRPYTLESKPQACHHFPLVGYLDSEESIKELVEIR